LQEVVCAFIGLLSSGLSDQLLPKDGEVVRVPWFHVEMPSGGQAVFPSFLARNLGLAGRRQSEYAVLLLELVTLPTSLLEFVFIAFPGRRLVS
jgi:hypothetical protein